MNTENLPSQENISSINEQSIVGDFVDLVKKELAIEGIKNAQRKFTPIVEQIEGYLSTKYDFRFNPVLSRTEFKVKTKSTYTLLDERAFNSLYSELNKNKINFRDKILKGVLNSDFVPEVDPFAEYFNNLPKWDGETDYIKALGDTLITTNQPFWNEAFKRWIVATVACAINPNITNHEVLVLSGTQGKGKTSWLNRLVPPALELYIHIGTINPSNKDTLIQLAENLLINLDELENLNKNDLGSLKSIITQGKIRVRRAYGEFTENYVRRASFMASVNDFEFLTDMTGNRRYLTFTTLSINEKHTISLDHVYSQAYHLFKNVNADGNKFKYWFDKEDMAMLNANNEQYVRSSPEEDFILKYFEVPNASDTVFYMTPTEMISHINEKEKFVVLNQIQSSKRFGQALQKLNFRKFTQGNQKPYRLKYRSSAPALVEEIGDPENINAAIAAIESGNAELAKSLGLVNVNELIKKVTENNSASNAEESEASER